MGVKWPALTWASSSRGGSPWRIPAWEGGSETPRRCALVVRLNGATNLYSKAARDQGTSWLVPPFKVWSISPTRSRAGVGSPLHLSILPACRVTLQT